MYIEYKIPKSQKTSQMCFPFLPLIVQSLCKQALSSFVP